MRSIHTFLLLFLLLPVLIIADVSVNDDPDSKLSFYTYIDYELGQIVRGRSLDQFSFDSTYAHSWLQNAHGRFGLQYKPFDWLRMRTGFELRMWFNTFPYKLTVGETEPRDKYWSIYLHESQGIFKFIDNDSWFMDMSVGYFPYKYNPEVRDLGEYLFRSGTYPVYLINYFDLPLARLAGLRYSLGYNQDLFGLRFDLLGITETNMWPYHDITIAPILDFNILKDESGKHSVINIGGGVSFAHVIPVDDSITTPSYKRDATTYEVDTTGFHLNPSDPLDTIWDINRSYYTFSGTKLMARTTIDPFAFLRGREGLAGDFFGQSGGKLYGEIAIIGLKNYPLNTKHDSIIGTDTVTVGYTDSSNGNPHGYTDIKERMPIMFGFTLPCWKILDVLAFEFEYFDCPYPNDYARVYRERVPLPGKVAVNPNDSTYTYDFYKEKNKWKWAIFMKKNISDHFSMILQICRDHQRWEYGGHVMNWDFEEAMVKKDHWAWNFKTEFKF
jgi:hypothetical protein